MKTVMYMRVGNKGQLDMQRLFDSILKEVCSFRTTVKVK